MTRSFLAFAGLLTAAQRTATCCGSKDFCAAMAIRI